MLGISVLTSLLAIQYSVFIICKCLSKLRASRRQLARLIQRGFYIIFLHDFLKPVKVFFDHLGERRIKELHECTADLANGWPVVDRGQNFGSKTVCRIPKTHLARVVDPGTFHRFRG